MSGIMKKDVIVTPIPQAHLTPKRTVTRTQTDTRAFPLTEAPRPKYDGSTQSIAEILDWLDVEKSQRYRANIGQTFCNIYAYDYATMLGAYLPRVWWSTNALDSKDFSAITYGSTVREMNVNALYIWFQQYGKHFGWQSVQMKDAQAHANNGKCVIALAANKNRSRSGHITVIVPETSTHKANRVNNVLMIPVQSHAGTRNEKYMVRNWQGSAHERVLYFVFG